MRGLLCAMVGLVWGIWSAAGQAAEGHSLPDPSLTPGAVFSDVTADDVCEPGYSKSVRHVTPSLKQQVFEAYHQPGNHQGICSGSQGCEVDHLISLELGGSNDFKNLWPEPYDGVWNARMKDRLENKLHKLVCDGSLSLKEAQQAIANNWINAYKKYVDQASDGYPK